MNEHEQQLKHRAYLFTAGAGVIGFLLLIYLFFLAMGWEQPFWADRYMPTQDEYEESVTPINEWKLDVQEPNETKG